MGKPVSERQSILRVAAARDEGCGTGDTVKSSAPVRYHHRQHINSRFLQATCPSYCPPNSVKAMKAANSVVMHPLP